MTDGIILIDKEVGLSSFAVIARLRRIFAQKRIGHCGTLDPFASGLLPVCLGRFTGAVQFMEGYDKSYRFLGAAGQRRDTMDREGRITEHLAPEDLRQMALSGEAERRLREAFSSIPEEFWQCPPMYSAVKVQGRPLYRYAREGKEVERKKRLVRVHLKDFNYLGEGDQSGEEETEGKLFFSAEARVSKGTYIRSLVDKIGERSGLHACCWELRRTSCGPYTLSDRVCTTEALFDRFNALNRDSEACVRALWEEGFIYPLASAFPMLPRLSLKAMEARDLLQGKALSFTAEAFSQRLQRAENSEVESFSNRAEQLDHEPRILLFKGDKCLAMARSEADGTNVLLRSQRVFVSQDSWQEPGGGEKW